MIPNLHVTSSLYWVSFVVFFNFNFIQPKVNTDYIRQVQVINIINIDNLRTIKLFIKFLMKTNLKYHLNSINLFRPLANAGTVGASQSMVCSKVITLMFNRSLAKLEL